MKRLTDALHTGARVFVAGLSSESALWQDELRADPERASGVHFIAVQFPGIDRIDHLGSHPTARLTAFFMSPAPCAPACAKAAPTCSRSTTPASHATCCTCRRSTRPSRN